MKILCVEPDQLIIQAENVREAGRAAMIILRIEPDSPDYAPYISGEKHLIIHNPIKYYTRNGGGWVRGIASYHDVQGIGFRIWQCTGWKMENAVIPLPAWDGINHVYIGQGSYYEGNTSKIFVPYITLTHRYDNDKRPILQVAQESMNRHIRDWFKPHHDTHKGTWEALWDYWIENVASPTQRELMERKARYAAKMKLSRLPDYRDGTTMYIEGTTLVRWDVFRQMGDR